MAIEQTHLKEIKAIEKKIASLEKARDTFVSRVNDLQKDIDMYQKKKNSLNNAFKKVQNEIEQYEKIRNVESVNKKSKQKSDDLTQVEELTIDSFMEDYN